MKSQAELWRDMEKGPKTTDDFASPGNTVCPHQGLGNVPIPGREQKLQLTDNTEPLGKIGCQEWLGGLIKHYYRQAA